jgi:hypothetical protein
MGPGFEDSVREIIGVVGDTKKSGLDSPAPGILYLPAAQIPDMLTRMGNHLLGMSWVVRTKSGQVDVATPGRHGRADCEVNSSPAHCYTGRVN